MPERPDNLVGETLGSYRIERQLGAGGMGAVYLGVHPQIESRVAIKVLHPGYDTMAGIVGRFIDEARAVNRIGHPGIVRIHDCATQEGIGVYLVMEYLEGETLADVIEREGQLGAEQACGLLRQCAAALSASHDAGIVHRDLKPENLFLVEDAALAGGIRVKVLDFGIAKLIDDQGAMSGKTETGAVFGTPLFMAPEQCVSAKDVDHRADIYGLGAIAYRALSGQYPFAAGSVGQLVLMQQTESPPPLREHNPAVPEGLADAIHRALRTKREERFETMAEFGAALQPFADLSQITGPIRRESLVRPVPRDPASQPRRLASQPRDPAASARDPAASARDPAAGAGVPVPEAQPAARDAAVGARATVLEKPAGGPAARGQPVGPNTTLSGATGQRVEVQPARPRRAAYLIGLPVALALGAVVIFALTRGGGGDEDDGPGAGTIAASAPVAATPPVVDAGAIAAPTQDAAPADVEPAAKKVRVVLTGIPADAEVRLDGTPVEPHALELEADGKAHLLRVVARGYLPAEQRFVADVDQTLRFRLRRKRTRRRGYRRTTAPSPAAAPGPAAVEPDKRGRKKPASATPTFEDL